MSKGVLLVISAPSGCGKSTIVKKLRENNPNLKFSVSATTRSPREGEVHGKDYFFVNREEFERMIQNGEFLEYAQYSGNYYGTPHAEIINMLDAGKDVILEIDVQGAAQIKEKISDALLIFIMPPSLEVLRERLINRGTDSMEVIERRMLNAERECNEAYNFNHIVVNEYVEKAVSEIEKLIAQQKEIINS